MILEKLSVSGFRSFADRFEFTPHARFTVIHAPNGTGKSTLLDALYYGLLERHTVGGVGAAQRFTCLGRDLTPTIEIDFAVDGARYHLRKVFLNSRFASLQRFESGRYVALKDGGAADDFVRELFSAEAPGKGPVDPSKHLGFAHVLWAPARASFAELPASAGDQIRAMLGGAGLAVTDGERVVQERVASEYLRYFTANGSLAAKAAGANIPALRAQAANAQAAQTEARQQYLRLEQLSVAYADREADAERMSSVRSGLRTEIESMKSAVNVYIGLKTSAERAARTEADARVAHQQLATVIRSLAALRSERDLLGVARTECFKERQEFDAAAVALHQRYTVARKAVEDAGAALAEVQRRAGAVTAARSYLDSCGSVERLQALLAEYDAAATTLADLTAAQSVVVAPKRAELETLRQAAAQADALQAAIATSALALDIEAASDLTIDVVTGETTGAMTISAGSTATVAAADDAVVIDVPGLGRIRARGTDGAAKARKQLRPVMAQLEVARERYGTSSIPELAVRTEQLEEMKRTALQSQAAMTVMLGDRPIESVRESLATAFAHVASIENDHPEWCTDRPDATALRASFDRDLQHATDTSKLAQIELRAVEQPKDEADAKIVTLKTQEAEFAVKLESNAAQLKALEADGLDDRSRAETESTLALTWVAAKAEQASIADRLARFVEDPHVALNNLQEAERDAGTSYENALGDAKTHRAQLDMQTSLGSYAKLAAAEEHVANCESTLMAAQNQASAIDCLHSAFNRIEKERIASVVGPVTAASTRYLTRIVGLRRGEIAIGEGLSPTGLIDELSGLPLSIDGTLSSGEKEQIYLATRLALAEVLAEKRGRQLFVVDDALTATDPNRLRRFVGILEELSRERLQVIVTTADPSRYLGIAGATHIDLATALLSDLAA
jgi:DNA repair exonuclease SbcCD ATPase subunit